MRHLRLAACCLVLTQACTGTPEPQLGWSSKKVLDGLGEPSRMLTDQSEIDLYRGTQCPRSETKEIWIYDNRFHDDRVVGFDSRREVICTRETQTFDF